MPYNGRITYLSDTSVEALANALDRIHQSGKKTVLILACSANDYSAEQLTPVLRSSPLSVLGAVFPSIVQGEKLYEIGTLLISYNKEIPVTVFPDLKSCNEQSVSDKLKHPEQSSFIVMADALCGGMEPFIEALYQHLGSGLEVIGGGAGSLDFIKKPCLFSNQGFIQDAALVALLPESLHSASGHGWEILDGPYVVTESEGHQLISINYQPAFDFYQEAIYRLSNRELTEDNFFEVAMNHPFGISELNGELLVRDPIVSKNGQITCVGNVPQNATLYILQGDANHLIEAAQTTSEVALADKKRSSDTVVLFDCISRQIYLGDRVDEELSSINKQLPEGNQLVGAFSLGELANRQGGPIQLMNKSIVLGAL